MWVNWGVVMFLGLQCVQQFFEFGGGVFLVFDCYGWNVDCEDWIVVVVFIEMVVVEQYVGEGDFCVG